LELNWIINWDAFKNFNPNKEITRAEFLKIILLSHCYDYNDVDTSNLKYKDLDKNTWQAKVAKKATDLWLIHWYSDWTARMDNVITKAEALKILYNLRILWVWQWKSQNVEYEDVDVDWEKNMIKDLEALWLINPKVDSYKFNPDSWVDREFMVDYLIKTIRLY
jgi:hypothetical protein